VVRPPASVRSLVGTIVGVAWGNFPQFILPQVVGTTISYFKRILTLQVSETNGWSGDFPQFILLQVVGTTISYFSLFQDSRCVSVRSLVGTIVGVAWGNFPQFILPQVVGTTISYFKRILTLQVSETNGWSGDFPQFILLQVVGTTISYFSLFQDSRCVSE
jgi:predicted phage gp36 major capsid-like protein